MNFSPTRYHDAAGAQDTPSESSGRGGPTTASPRERRPNGLLLGITNCILFMVVTFAALFVAGFFVRVAVEVVLLGWRAL